VRKPDETINKALREVEVQRAVILALTPLSPRMRAAVLRYVLEWIQDQQEQAAS